MVALLNIGGFRLRGWARSISLRTSRFEPTKATFGISSYKMRSVESFSVLSSLTDPPNRSREGKGLQCTRRDSSVKSSMKIGNSDPDSTQLRVRVDRSKMSQRIVTEFSRVGADRLSSRVLPS